MSSAHDCLTVAERAHVEGASTLGDAELVALLCGLGAVEAAELLEASGGLAGLVKREHWGTLANDGATSAVARLEAALELWRRIDAHGSLASAVRCNQPATIADWAIPRMRGLGHEEIWVVALDTRHRMVGVRRVAIGGVSKASTSAADLLRLVLQVGGAAFVLVHNHPSGDPSPSVDDVSMTAEVQRAANAVALPLLDHVIVGGERFTSLLEMGMM